jgi:hypothetical protein
MSSRSPRVGCRDRLRARLRTYCDCDMLLRSARLNDKTRVFELGEDRTDQKDKTLGCQWSTRHAQSRDTEDQAADWDDHRKVSRLVRLDQPRPAEPLTLETSSNTKRGLTICDTFCNSQCIRGKSKVAVNRPWRLSRWKLAYMASALDGQEPKAQIDHTHVRCLHAHTT